MRDKDILCQCQNVHIGSVRHGILGSNDYQPLELLIPSKL